MDKNNESSIYFKPEKYPIRNRIHVMWIINGLDMDLSQSDTFIYVYIIYNI